MELYVNSVAPCVILRTFRLDFGVQMLFEVRSGAVELNFRYTF